MVAVILCVLVLRIRVCVLVLDSVLHFLLRAVCVLPVVLHDFRPVLNLLHLLHVLDVIIPLVLYIR